MKNYKIQIIIKANLSSLVSSGISSFSIGCEFAGYGSFKPTIFIQNFIIDLRTVFSHIPLHFSFTVPY